MLSVRVLTLLSRRKNTSGVFLAGAEQATPSTHTGVIGERVTTPSSPLGAMPWVDVAPSAVGTSAAISNAHFASISSQCAVRLQRLVPSQPVSVHCCPRRSRMLNGGSLRRDQHQAAPRAGRGPFPP